ncbi:ThiF family adenylyltransferase [Flammeovirga yaeyamensis]|uniref:ThiF family adenylyltransferase n=1 Tax=Flammeovirga yaeyamensis TaxID=367791 RepID=A0AAX1N653_9BACT|nr:ThiF family adenylyltransferase [Flammeovirga yaeyamensis]MBB3701254.1 tRNA A37 threonylcarbamoyladenosine dehydratase [Flammeovirga yaeyamensis]NMF38275.1 ThiF family adenylyltransferase [Flammeovirga yaeyamensis]QWG02687.1 ThiF family adenylyltransferase [Flammeovirga yaeyamensis]
MSLPQINPSTDLKRLQNEGYEVTIIDSHIMISNIPYVNSQKQIKRGDLITPLNLNGGNILKPATHIAHFVGEYPCSSNGQKLLNIVNSQQRLTINNKLTPTFYLSSKPKHNGGKYDDYYELLTTYCRILCHEAQSIDENVTPKTFSPIMNKSNNISFNYVDTNSSRANISFLENKFYNQRIGIIGLGGTGSYILDLIAKTPVKEISLFDGDKFLQHNAFRSPGAPSLEELKLQKNKASRMSEIYSNMHKNITVCDEYLTEQNLNKVDGLSFIFISIDDNEAKKLIIDHLISKCISFIDVGISVSITEDQDLIGVSRTTLVTPNKKDHIDNRIPLVKSEENEYNSNIQISELNMLNASIAVIKWKQLFQFYKEHERSHNLTMDINELLIYNDE